MNVGMLGEQLTQQCGAGAGQASDANEFRNHRNKTLRSGLITVTKRAFVMTQVFSSR
jgi:hypothetical protein